MADRTTAGEGAAPRPLPYTPSLDGVRALAVLAVLAFHGGVAGFGGGFLGVSTFFTLSGFLITSLLLVHVHQPDPSGRAILGTFWTRRARRLLPAALVGIALATAVTISVGSAEARQALAGDVLGALGEVANWRFLASERSYGDLFAAPSALLHHWSLAIEEQFYLLVPLLVVAALRWRDPGRRRATLAAGMGLLLAASVWSSIRLLGDADRLYYGSDTRAAELLVGCLLAIAVDARGGSSRLVRTDRGRRAVAAAGVLAVLASVAAWVVVDRGDTWLHPGGLLGYAALSCLVVLGALVRGPQSTVLAVPVLVWIGQRSYGIYVLHWPLFLLLDERRTGVDGAALFVVRLVASLVAAAALYVLVEQPIRHRRSVPWLPRRRPLLGAGLVAAVLVAIVVAPPSPAPTNIDFASVQTQFEAELADAHPGATDGLPAGTEPVAPPAPLPEPPPPWLVIVGDEGAAGTAYAAQSMLGDRADAHAGGSAADRSCSLLRGTAHRDAGGVRPTPPACLDRVQRWVRFADAADADVVLVQLGRTEVRDHGIEGRWAALGDPDLDARLARELDQVIGELADDDRVVVLVTLPTDWGVLGVERPWELDEVTYRDRATRFNRLLTDAAAAHPRTTRVLDVDRWHREHGDGAAFRPGGAEADPALARQLTAFVIDKVIALHREAWTARAREAATEPPGPAGSPDSPGSAADPPALRVLVVGDSTALPFAVALHGRGGEHHDVEVASVARSNCGLARDGKRRAGDEAVDVASHCPDWEPEFADAVARFRPDVVLVVDSVWELGDRMLPGDGHWRAIGDPLFDAHLRAELDRAVDVLHEGGATVVFVRYPRLDLSGFEAADPSREDIDEDARLPRLNALLDDVASERRPATATIDLAEHARSFPAGELDPGRRPDGVHFTEPAARDIVDAWLLGELRAIHERRPS